MLLATSLSLPNSSVSVSQVLNFILIAFVYIQVAAAHITPEFMTDPQGACRITVHCAFRPIPRRLVLALNDAKWRAADLVELR
jgi:hypothetical protein